MVYEVMILLSALFHFGGGGGRKAVSLTASCVTRSEGELIYDTTAWHVYKVRSHSESTVFLHTSQVV